MSTVIEEFSRFASEYDRYNIIQEKVAETLINTLDDSSIYDSVLDVGCGNGVVFNLLEKRKVSINKFIALDSSSNMLSLHPSNNKTIKIEVDFNKSFIDKIPFKKFDCIISASALQWSKNLDFTLNHLSSLSSMHYYAIFTSNTFKTLHKVGGVISPIYSEKTLRDKILKYYKQVTFELKTYQLKFNSTREMLRYIKKSGVSSGERKLSYKETKSLMNNYPLDFLEFEVLFVQAKN